MKTLDLKFHGPLAWWPADDAEFIFDAEISKKPGIYLWTVETPEGHLVWYVGQTRTSFRQRMKEHFKEQMSGSYAVYDPKLLANGKRRKIWPGYYGRKETGRIPEFLDQMPSLFEAMIETARITRFFVAPMEGDQKFHLRVEGGLGNYLRDQARAGDDFLSKNLRYRLAWYEGEEHIELKITCPPEVRGMPKRLAL